MVRVNDNISDLEPTLNGQRPPNELDSLIRHSEYKPSKRQSRLASWQFLSFCSALFMIGWTDGSTGPLIPTITKFYGVCSPFPTFRPLPLPMYFPSRSALEQCLGYLCRIVRSVNVYWVSWYRLTTLFREWLRVHCWICLWSIELVSETWAFFFQINPSSQDSSYLLFR